eukprot:343504-Hanusia_phi.AAC.1
MAVALFVMNVTPVIIDKGQAKVDVIGLVPDIPLIRAICQNCGGTCPSGQYQSQACTATSDRVCSTCATCSSGQYASKACTSTSNTQCSQCPTWSCSTGQYLSGCGGTSAGKCTTCPSCPSGQFRIGCVGTSSGTCSVCPAGQWASGYCYNCYVCLSGYYMKGCSGAYRGLCTQCASCPSGKYRIDCGLFNPGYCGVCASGEYYSAGKCLACSIAASQAPAGHYLRWCGNNSMGQFVP